MFNCKNYFQIIGHVMGSIYTPPSTFIFKTSFEAKLVYRYLKKKS